MITSSTLGLLAITLLSSASSALAQTSDCNAPSYTLSSQSDADALSLCSSLVGSLNIASNYTGALSLPNAQIIRGGIAATSCPFLQQIAMSSLNTVETLSLNNLTNLTDVSFPALTFVNNLYLTSLPSIRNVNFSAAVEGSYRPNMTNWTIQNTALSAFTAPMAEQISNIQIYNNSALRIMNFSNLSTVGNVSVSSNGDGAALSMSTLSNAGNLSFSNLGALNISQLEICSGNIHISNNNIVDLELDNLAHVDNNFRITDNPQLNTLSVSRPMYSVGSGYTYGYGSNRGSFIVTGNSQLNAFTVSGHVYGDMTFIGPWSNRLNIEVHQVDGSFELEAVDNSGGDRYDCSALISNVQDGELQVSSFVCNGQTAVNPPYGSRGGMTTGGKIGIGLGVIVIVVLIMCCFCCCRRRGKKGNKKQSTWAELPFSRSSIPTQPERISSGCPPVISRPYNSILDPGRQTVLESPRPTPQTWPYAGAPLSTEVDMELQSRTSIDDTASMSAVVRYVGETRVQQETGMEQTAPSSGVMPGTEQLPRYEPPPEYKP